MYGFIDLSLVSSPSPSGGSSLSGNTGGDSSGLKFQFIPDFIYPHLSPYISLGSGSSSSGLSGDDEGAADPPGQISVLSLDGLHLSRELASSEGLDLSLL